VHQRAKAAPFRVIDTHAGSGRYDLADAETSRSGEWREGIARLMRASLSPPARPLLAPYLDAIATFNGLPELTVYPGVDHDSWSATYDMSAGHDIYDWLLRFTVPGPAAAEPTGATTSTDTIEEAGGLTTSDIVADTAAPITPQEPQVTESSTT
jgi:hypothetical protein